MPGLMRDAGVNTLARASRAYFAADSRSESRVILRAKP